jgi:hypothetical protein
MRTVQRFVIVSLVAASLVAQKVETQPLNNQMVVHVETALDHLTVIELADPVTMVAVGNQSAFMVERRENKVFVKPLEESIQTNLFIWTAGARYSYELVPASSVAQMHFAIDQSSLRAGAQPMPGAEPAQNTVPLPLGMLTEAKAIRLYGERDVRGRVAVTLRDLYRHNGRLYLRYGVANRSAVGYQAARPAVFRMADVRAPVSLVPLGENQIGERLARSIKAGMASRLDVLDASPARFLEPGTEGVGWLVVPDVAAPPEDRALLRIEFAADSRGPVDAFLVLKTEEARNANRAGE